MLEIYRTAWGLVGNQAPWANIPDFIKASTEIGYVGVEFPIPYLNDSDNALDPIKAALDNSNLKCIALLASRPTEWGNAQYHLQEFRTQAEQAKELGISKAAVHCGADSFDQQTASSFIRDCQLIAEDCGFEPCFETHRGRIFGDPWRAADLLEKLPDIRLTSDLSHWHVIVDRDPQDIMDIFDEASRRTGHLHARIGHEKGPQVSDPRDPIWRDHEELYRRWWKISHDAALEAGRTLTAAPEFGPPPYMNMRPFSGERDADLVEINAWMRDRLIDWFGY